MLKKVSLPVGPMHFQQIRCRWEPKRTRVIPIHHEGQENLGKNHEKEKEAIPAQETASPNLNARVRQNPGKYLHMYLPPNFMPQLLLCLLHVMSQLFPGLFQSPRCLIQFLNAQRVIPGLAWATEI